MEALTPSQFQLTLVACDLAAHAGEFRAWDVTHLAGERYGYRGHPAIQRLLKLLVDKGYLQHDQDAGDRGGFYRVQVDAETGTRLYVDHLIDSLADDPRALDIAIARLHQRIESTTSAAAAV